MLAQGDVSRKPSVTPCCIRGKRSSTTALASGVCIGAYAEGKKEAADKAAEAALKSGDVEAYNAAVAESQSWAEGGSNRIALHVAGGALVAGLGGGGIGSAAQGAAGAGVAAWTAGDLNRLANGTRDALGGGDTAQLAGNVAANILAGGMGALVGGGAGAFAASNADLYNRSTGNGDGQGSTANSALGWIGDQLASAGRGAETLANQFAALVNANGPQGPYVSPDDLNGPGGSSKPPATGGSAVPVAVCVPPVCAVVPAVTPGTPGYVPSNATLNSGNGDSEAGSNASGDTNLASPDRTTHILTGDSTGGGHQWPGGPGKSVFPENWSGTKIMNAVSDIATDPSIPETVQANGRIVKNGTRDGIDIRVVIEPASKGGGIVTAFPTNVPRNPK